MAAGFGELDNESPVRIGSVVLCVTCFDNKVEGEVLCYDDTCKLLAIKSCGSSRKCDVTFVNLKYVKEVQILKDIFQRKLDVKDLPPLDISKLRAREADSIKEKCLREQGIAEAGIQLWRVLKEIFDKCIWQDKMLRVVNLDVWIEHPYTLDRYRGKPESIALIRKKIEKLDKDRQNGS